MSHSRSSDEVVGHEPDNVRSRPILLAALGLLIALILSAGGMWLLLRGSLSYRARLSEPADPLAASYGRAQPPQPRLQTDPIEDLQQLRRREDEALNNYGWSDRNAGVVRIPIERAIELMSAPPPVSGAAK